jgi:hypothetical protein
MVIGPNKLSMVKCAVNTTQRLRKQALFATAVSVFIHNSPSTWQSSMAGPKPLPWRTSGMHGLVPEGWQFAYASKWQEIRPVNEYGGPQTKVVPLTSR